MRRAAFPFALAAAILCAGWVAAREWTDATGKFRVQADFAEMVGDKVKLVRDDGKEILVPLSKLSTRDQNYVRKISGGDKKSGDTKDRDTASEVPVPEEDQKRAEELIEQAYHLFKLDPKGNASIVSSKLKEASRLNPQNIRAESIRGLLNLMVAFSPTRAHQNFTACVKRAPENAAMLNNLAVTEVKMRRFRQALSRWEKILEASPESPFVTHNLGRLLKVHNDRRLVMPKADAARCADLYASSVTGKKSPVSSEKLGWILMDFIEHAESADQPEIDPDLQNARIQSGGTGFVVKDDYIVTNRHVVDIEGATGIKIKVSGRSGLLEAEVVAISKSADVAVVRCEGIKLPSVPLTGKLPRRGSDVMVLGFPHFDQLGATIKSTRGAVTSLPSGATDGMMLLDAEINSGNSGGPIANQRGQIVAVTTAVYKPIGGTGGRYGAGIPTVSVMSFLQQHISGLRANDAFTEDLSWPDVDERVSRSTVLVLVEAAETEATGTVQFDGGILPINDPTCPACNGSKTIKKGFKRVKCGHCKGVGFDLDILGIRVEETGPRRVDPRRRR